MRSVLIYQSPELRELDQDLALVFLDDHLLKKGFQHQKYWRILRGEENVCDYVINNVINSEASKLVKAINESDDHAAKTSKLLKKKRLDGPYIYAKS